MDTTPEVREQPPQGTIVAVERFGLTGLQDNQKVSFDIESGRDGRDSAINLKLA